MIISRDEMKSQSYFYRNGFNTVLHWLFAEIFIIFLLIAAILYVIFSQQTPPYYVTTVEGRVMLLTPGT